MWLTQRYKTYSISDIFKDKHLFRYVILPPRSTPPFLGSKTFAQLGKYNANRDLYNCSRIHNLHSQTFPKLLIGQNFSQKTNSNQDHNYSHGVEEGRERVPRNIGRCHFQGWPLDGSYLIQMFFMPPPQILKPSHLQTLNTLSNLNSQHGVRYGKVAFV